MLYMVLLGLIVGGASAEDLTLQNRATGSAVVEAVVDMLTQSCVFDNDRLMLRRIAYAETEDGTASHTFDIFGGIWQVEEKSFTSTQASLSTELENLLKTEFNIDWKQAQYHDLLKPLYSGIAAMLKILAFYHTPGSIPQSVNNQAVYWSTYYTINVWTDGMDKYIAASKAVDTTCSSPKADVVFTVDGSGSIQLANFELVKLFIQDVVDTFEVSQQKVRVGLIEFSSSAEVQFGLSAHHNKEAVKAAVAAMPYFNGGTNSADGLYETKVMIEKEGRHNDGVPVVTIFLTDGESGDKTATEDAANELHSTLPQVTVFSVGVTSGPNMKELETIASEPKCMHVLTLANFSDIREFTNEIMKGACKAPGELTGDREINGSLAEGQSYYFKIKVKRDEDGVRIFIKVRAGGVKLFISWKVQNPSEALYDKMMEVGGGSKSIHIGWDTLPELNALSGTITDQVPLYGSIVGAQAGQNEFGLSYTDSGFQQTAGLLSVIAAFFALTRNCL